MPGLTIALLGPVELRHAGTEVPLGAAMQRGLLALLALDVGRTVPLDHLSAGLWGEHPPARARGLLQTYVSRLRAVLRPLGSDIVRHGPGYLLDLTADRVDLTGFRSLLARGRGADAPADLRAALGLWRGAPLEAVPPTALVERIRAGLTEEWVGARESLLAAELRAGRHREALAELTELAGEYPLRDEPLRLLLVGLHRAGRQAEALAAYDAGRLLREAELGLDPTPDLVDLHARILRNDPVLVCPSTASAPARDVPRQLPYDLADFTGRATQLDRLCALGGSGASSVVISAVDGMPGVGKTATVVRAAHALAPRFPDGQVFLDLHGFTPGRSPVDPATALTTLLAAFGVPEDAVPRDLDERAAAWRQELAGRRVLVVLDNAVDAAQVRPLIPGAPGALVLITSRRSLLGLDGAVPVSLDVLPDGEARALFAGVVGDRARSAPHATGEVVALCGHLPLAIRLAAARLSARPSWTMAELARRLRDQHGRLGELAADDRSMTATFQLSYGHLTPAEQRMFRLLGLHPGADIDGYAAGALAGVGHRAADDALERLVDAHLAHQVTPGRYRLHDLLREYARTVAHRVDPAADRHAAVTRLLEHYAHVVDRVDDHVRGRPVRPGAPGTPALASYADALAWYEAERHTLATAVAHAARHGWPAHAVRLANGLRSCFDVRGHTEAWISAQRHALAAHADLDDRQGLGDTLNSLATAYWHVGRYPDALDHYRHALDIRRALGDPRRTGGTLNNLGLVLRELGSYPEAVAHFEQALELHRAHGHPDVATPLLNLGTVYGTWGRYPEALDHFERSLAACREVGDRLTEAGLLNNIGKVHAHRHRHAEALATLHEALDLHRALGHRLGESNSLTHIADVYGHLGRHADAVGYLHRALDLVRATGNRTKEGTVLNALGRACLAAGRPAEAADGHRRALELGAAIRHRETQARAHDGLGDALADEDPAAARAHWEQARAGYTALGFPEADTVATRLAAHA
ncbi:SARP family transcriptional regulator [Longispora fulva]|uniref:DNA-binding SARP family transcriptional activator/Tfp pilus assembly protein PilF n=1 Tax=Longispora fulva TaxID=619741 RepID=A0A8J7GI14_9ACTN|nr:tetratricopeptide repeat protein [Longispora fulva]MBG6137017.1 DNA-binding SARP family transcriptional activator/Tfp pilus assembly protein PilF [Longispora fulva]GIG61629.1 SARP family transcriptional regulator [Longispora fulva]